MCRFVFFWLFIIKVNFKNTVLYNEECVLYCYEFTAI